MNQKIAIGTDIGGSHISCIAVDLDGHRMLEKTYSHRDVDSNGPADEILQAWAEAIRSSIELAGASIPAGIGLAMPGPFDYLNGIGDYTGVQKFGNLKGVNIGKEILKRLNYNQEIPVRFLNDASSFAVGAVWSDDSMQSKNVLAITLGTGFGSTFIMDSLPVINDERVPKHGFVYHLPFKGGIADDNFSTRGLIEAYRQRTGRVLKGVKDLAELADSDNQAMETMQQFGSELGEFLGPWIQKAGISVIIIGGNISKSYALFGPEFRKKLAEQGFDVNIRLSAETEQMAMLGSARLADENYFSRIQPLLKYM